MTVIVLESVNVLYILGFLCLSWYVVDSCVRSCFHDINCSLNRWLNWTYWLWEHLMLIFSLFISTTLHYKSHNYVSVSGISGLWQVAHVYHLTRLLAAWPLIPREMWHGMGTCHIGQSISALQAAIVGVMHKTNNLSWWRCCVVQD